MLKFLSSCEKCFKIVIEVFLAIVFAAMILLVAVQVVCRYLLPTPLAWTEELVRVLMAYVVFLGTTVVYEARGHVCVDNLVNAVPKAPRRIMLLFSYLVQFAFCALMLVGSVKFLPVISMRASNVLFNISLKWFYMCAPISAVFTVVFVIRDFILEVVLGKELNENA